jgi:hypothetical protein
MIEKFRSKPDVQVVVVACIKMRAQEQLASAQS